MIYDVMLKRRSIRRFKKETPSQESLEDLVKAAMAAPSASNKQPWRFHVITNKEMIATAAEMVEHERQKLISIIREDFRSQFKDYSENFMAFQHAPAMIVVTYRVFPLLSNLLEENDKSNRSGSMKKIENNSALISTACAIQNLLLMAENTGLGACCMTGPLIAAEKLKKYLSIHERWEMASLIAVGYADENPSMPPRKPITSILKWFV